MTQSVRQLVGFAAVLALAGCGGTKTAAPAPVTASAMLGPAGGSLGVTGADGARFDLVLPAGALAVSTALTLTAAPPEAGQRFHVILGPPGVSFDLLAPATLTIHLPDPALPATGGLEVDGAGVPFTRVAGGALSVPLRATSPLAASAQATPGPAARAAPRSLSLASCGTPTISSNGVTGANTVDLALYAACMQAAVDQLDATGRYQDAIRASLAVASLLQRIGGNGAGDARTFLDAATATACRARGAAFSLAAGVTITDLGEVFTFMRPMAYWEAVTQQLGASCGGQASFSDAAGALTDKGLALYDANRPQVQDPAGARYHATVAEAQDARTVRGEVASLQAPAPVTAVLDTQVKERAERSLLDELLDGPWKSCRAGDDQPLLDVMNALGAPDAGRDVAQYCSVSITAEVYGAPPTSTSLGTAGPLGDTAHGTRTIRGYLDAALDGSLRLTGSARALTCPAGTDSPEALVLALNGHEVRRLTGPDYLGNPLDVDLPTLLASAGLDPANPPDTLVLTITRDGAACSGYWGTNPAPLVSVDLRSAPLQVAVTYAKSSSSNILAGDGCGALGGVEVLSTDFSMPFRFSATECGNHSTTLAVDTPDPRTVVISDDFTTTASSRSEDYVSVEVTFPRPGTVTTSLSSSWILSGSACGTTPNGDPTFHTVWLDSYLKGVTQAETGYDICPWPYMAAYSTSASFAVEAGQTEAFVADIVNAPETMHGAGEVGRIVFTPSP